MPRLASWCTVNLLLSVFLKKEKRRDEMEIWIVTTFRYNHESCIVSHYIPPKMNEHQKPCHTYKHLNNLAAIKEAIDTLKYVRANPFLMLQ